MNKIKVVHVLTDTNVGGAGTLLYNTMACADYERFDYLVALPLGSRLTERLASLPCRVVQLRGGADRSFAPGDVVEYVRLLRAERPDILHTHASLSARVAGRLAGIPVCVYTRHCVFPLKPWQKNGLFRRAFRHASRTLSDRVVAVAEAARDQLIDMGMDGQQIEVIINGVMPVRGCTADELTALRGRLGLDKTQFVVGMSARLEDYKGQGTLLRAAQICLAQHDDFRFLLVGDGSAAEAFRRLARELGVAHAVIFAGFAEDMAPYYHLMNVNVNASFGTETSSLSLSEGMSVGVPCVASRYGGNPKMVVDGENGILFEPKNHAELAQALLRLYDDRALLARMSRRATEHYASRLTARAMTDKLQEMYVRVWEQKRGRNCGACRVDRQKI